MHISQSAYGRIETGESSSWATYLEPICNLYNINPEELVKQESIIVNQNQKAGKGAFIMNNQTSEKLIEQYELRIQEKDNYIIKLEKLIDKLTS